MESINYLDELIKEYMLFRGYIKSYTAFSSEKTTDLIDNPDPSLIAEQICHSIRVLHLNEVMDIWSTLTSRFFVHLSSTFSSTIKMMEQSIKRAYVIRTVNQALKTGDKTKVNEFYEKFAAEMTVPGSEWEEWFILPYLKDPMSHPRFAPYFSRRWFVTFNLSLKNFLTTAFQSLPLPKLMAFNSERNERKILTNELRQVKQENEKLKAQLQSINQSNKQGPLRSVRVNVSTGDTGSSTPQLVPTPSSSTVPSQTLSHSTSQQLAQAANPATNSSSNPSVKSPPLPPTPNSSSVPAFPSVPLDALDIDFPDPAFTVTSHCHVPGHPRSTVIRTRFSLDGARLASAGSDGSLKLWSTKGFIDGSDDTLMPLATFPIHSSELTCMEWDSAKNAYLACGGAQGKIRLLGVENRRLIGEMDVDRECPVVVNLACSPCDNLLVSASGTRSWATLEAGKGSLDAWDLNTCKRSLSFHVESLVSQINSIVFNHNGNMLVSAGADGMVRIYDMSTKKPIMGWPAHQGQVSCVRLCSDETTVMSAGLDGRIIEWSLHRIGKVVRSFSLPSSRAGSIGITAPNKDGSVMRGELSMDADTQHFALSSASSLFAPPSFNSAYDSKQTVYQNSAFLYSVHSPAPVQALVGHISPVMTVDWHPSLPVVATGASDGIRMKFMKQIDGRYGVDDDVKSGDEDEDEEDEDDDEEDEEEEEDA